MTNFWHGYADMSLVPGNEIVMSRGEGVWILHLCFACVPGLMSRTATDQRYERAVSVTGALYNAR